MSVQGNQEPLSSGASAIPSEERLRLKARALALGNDARAESWQELASLLSCESADVRRAAASACGKVVRAHGDVGGLLAGPLFLAIGKEVRPQVLQYMLRAFWHCAPYVTEEMCDRLVDISRDPNARPFVREVAAEAIARAAKCHNEQVSRTRHWCTRCRKPISAAESHDSIERYGKPYCRRCFDERRLSDVNFEAKVEGAKRLRVTDEVAVQSQGEKRIAAYLEQHDIAYIYDANYRIAVDKSIRPDFYLPEFNLYIEYWGMDTPDYLERKREKLILYQRAGLRLISLDARDFADLEARLEAKLSRYFRVV